MVEFAPKAGLPTATKHQRRRGIIPHDWKCIL